MTISGINDKMSIGERARDLAPFVSLMIVVASLFTVVFCKMEVRRMGYSVLKLSRQERQMRDHERQQLVQLAKITRPERLQAVAQNRLTFKKPESGQIIQMTESGIAFRQ
jgi:cell division protein FtsL